MQKRRKPLQSHYREHLGIVQLPEARIAMRSGDEHHHEQERKIASNVGLICLHHCFVREDSRLAEAICGLPSAQPFANAENR